MAVLAAYRDEPTVTVRDLAARFGVGKSTIALWLKEAGLSRERGARKGAPMANRLVVEDDFKAVLLGWYGAGIERHALTVLNQRRADSTDSDNAVALSSAAPQPPRSLTAFWASRGMRSRWNCCWNA